ncbi:hypothetical protein JOD43_003616 [Pullulanibacillus pueri]|uniref:LiaF transmembrane domain-containing protein n=1 Tax=Pullulanibacillus pueri TaxID=1437324 RepID=A0A8J2ZYU3_9BACL|nr:hypothetical protein [Pullulanibacillus pueri]MBM7683436.1 hypothetical protein [Pullulanibacillus pueri]GGH87397.1 hypothetical protein GCM10007096_37320 [Pullulanibacillus pueri]
MKRQLSFTISLPKIVTAIIFIYIGGWLLLSTLGLMSASMKDAMIIFIPYALIIWGLSLLIAPFISAKSEFGGNWLFGLFFLAYGSAVLGGMYHVFNFEWQDVWKLWPLFIVYVGFMIVFEGSKKGHKHAKKIEKMKRKEMKRGHDDWAVKSKVLSEEIKNELKNELEKELREVKQEWEAPIDEIKVVDKSERRAERERRQAERQERLAKFSQQAPINKDSIENDDAIDSENKENPS